MYEIKFPKNLRYDEIGQTNPIRWAILFKQEDGSFEDITGKFKCRDFFNDVVAAKHGVFFSVYGFDNRRIKMNDEGMYIELTGLINSTSLAKSIEQLINPKAVEQLGEEAKLRFIIKDKTSGLLLIPKILFNQTYTISLVTMLIRDCNREVVRDSWEEMLDRFNEAWDTRTKEYVKKNGFFCPSKTKDYWYFYTVGINSSMSKESLEGSSYNIHNCGIRSWLMAAEYKD